MHKIKIVIADDHSIVRDGLRRLIEDQKDMELVGEAVHGRDALTKVKTLKPDVIVLDLGMPFMNGMNAAKRIGEVAPNCKMVILSMHGSEAYVHEMLSAGAWGYVLKSSPTSEVLEAIRAAHRETYYLSPKINADIISVYLKDRREQPAVRGYNLLSEREQEIFRLIVEGNTTRQIADILCISPKTVEKYRGNISQKLGLKNLVEMVKYAIKIGILNPELWND